MARADIAKRLRPTKRSWGLLVAGALLLVGAYLLGRVELLALGGFFVALPLGTWLLRALFKPRLRLERTVFPHTLAVGDRIRVVNEIENLSIVALEPVTYVDLTPGASVSSVGGVLQSIASRLHRNERKRRRRIAYTLDSMRRGVHRMGPLFLENVDGLGLTRRVLRVGESHEVEVWPRVHEISALDVPSTRTGGETEAGLAAAGDSDDVLTREYRRGDAMRRVHWRATARHGELQVRQEEHHAEVSSLVVLDTTRSPVERATPAPATIFDLMDTPERADGAVVDPVFEHAVSVAASVVVRLHELGYETELFETKRFLDDAEHPRQGGLRVAAEESLETLMRHLMVTQPDEHARTPARDSALDDLVARARRLHRVPLVVIHRALDGVELDAVRGLATIGTPAIAVLVAEREVPEALQESFSRAGWDVVVMTTDGGDPWASAARTVAA